MILPKCSFSELMRRATEDLKTSQQKGTTQVCLQVKEIHVGSSEAKIDFEKATFFQ